MNVFDIIGPIMIGPSSSHTAGAVRLGRVANKVLNQEAPKEVMVELSGSFAKTYRGHGTDRALLAGIMGYHSYSEEIRDIFSIADKAGITYRFVPTQIPGSHPNTARIHVKGVNGTPVVVQGASIGGGNIRVDSINGMAVDFNGEHNTILVPPLRPSGRHCRSHEHHVAKIQRRQHWKLQAFPSCQRGHCHDDD